MSTAPDFIPRESCLRCHKPQVTCVCAYMPRVDNRTRVLVLQHPRERAHPIGTARFAELGLQNSRVEVAWDANVRETEPPAWLPPDTALLYPSDGARDLHALAAHELPKNLLVLDGTWNTAHSLYREKTWLHALPHLRFTPAAPGRYRLRKEPELDYVSTIEAIVEALRVLEPENTALDSLLQAFDTMIDAQLVYVTQRKGGQRMRKHRPGIERRTPRVLLNDFARVVVVYGDASRPGALPFPREFLHFSAVSLADDACFERVMQAEGGLPDPEHMRHMQLTEADFARGIDRAKFGADWAVFLAEVQARLGWTQAPLLAAWNQSTLDLLAQTMGEPASRLSLKSAYRAVHGKGLDGLDAVVAHEGLRLHDYGVRGRAGRRISNVVAIARYINARATPQPPLAAASAEASTEAGTQRAEQPSG